MFLYHRISKNGRFLLFEWNFSENFIRGKWGWKGVFHLSYGSENFLQNHVSFFFFCWLHCFLFHFFGSDTVLKPPSKILLNFHALRYPSSNFICPNLKKILATSLGIFIRFIYTFKISAVSRIMKCLRLSRQITSLFIYCLWHQGCLYLCLNETRSMFCKKEIISDQKN